MSSSMDPDQDRCSVGPDLGLTICKGYQQMTNVAASKEGVKERRLYKNSLPNEEGKPKLVV